MPEERVTTRVWGTPEPSSSPTAMQLLELKQETPSSTLFPTPTSGLAIVAQFVPFHVSTRVCSVPLSSKAPTALQCDALEHATELSEAS